MAEIRITREHGLGLEQARALALRWAEVAEQKLEMECTYEQGAAADLVSFQRPGASGELCVEPGQFRLRAKLGLLLGVFRSRIEAEIVRNLDNLLAEQEPLQAFNTGLAEHEAKRAAKKKTK
ncbi:MAG: polyhydroxyalkanoic acid system family protein [Ramlibacter sp.]